MRPWVVGLEAFVAVTATAGGTLLALRPDGSLLDADQSALADSPFTDWRIPGLLLLALVGGGFALAAFAEWHEHSWAPVLSLVAGVGLVVFELAELPLIGFQPLQVVMALIGATVVVLAAPGRTARHRAPRHRSPRPSSVGSAGGTTTWAGPAGPFSGRKTR